MTQQKSLGLFDVTAIIVGIIIGSAIYQTPSTIAGFLGSAHWIILVWILGGGLSFIGALCYAELASAHPKEGGDYFFLHHAFGDWAGFLYAWGRLWVIHSGNIAMMAAIAGIYGAKLFPIPHAQTVYAICAVIIFTGINCCGVRQGKISQNILASAQIIGLVGVILVAFFFSPGAPAPVEPVKASSVTFQSFLMALIFVQLTFGGWSDCAFVASEVKRPEKNILRALLLGLAIVTLIYLLINLALLAALGAQGMAASSGVMAQVMEQSLGTAGGRIISALVVICALGSVNGMILVGGRIYHAFGQDHSLFRFLGQWNPKSSVPLSAFLIQGVIACLLLLSGSFEQLVIYTSAAHWLFMGMVGISLIVFRKWEPNLQRPFRVPLFPVIPLIYIASCGILFHSSLTYANSQLAYGAWLGFALVLSGLPVYWISKRLKR